MTVIFLDFDGVLNNTPWLCRPEKRKLDMADTNETRWDRELRDFDPKNIAVLNDLLSKVPEAKIVVSSSWRYGMAVDTLKKLLETLGVPAGKVVDKTPHSTSAEKNGLWISSTRGEEIKVWLTAHPEVQHFVILDDDRDMAPFMRHLVLTDRQKGLQSFDVPYAQKILQIVHKDNS
jgi:hypothetical protein